MKRVLSLILVIMLLINLAPVQIASAAVKLSKTKFTLDEGKTYTLKISGTTKTVKWSTSDKAVATVSTNGKVKAIQAGNATITATVSSRKYKCTVIIKPRYGEGTYKVGKDIVAGEYVLFNTSDHTAYYDLCSDSTGGFDSIISNDNFIYNDIVTIEDGQYLELTRCYAVPIERAKVDTSGSGTFKVGLHLKAGEYKIESTSDYFVYLEVASNSLHSIDSIITNDNFNGTKYITVEDGQYLKISRGKIIE